MCEIQKITTNFNWIGKLFENFNLNSIEKDFEFCWKTFKEQNFMFSHKVDESFCVMGKAL